MQVANLGIIFYYSNNKRQKNRGAYSKKAPLPLKGSISERNYMFMPPSTWMTWPVT